jgi:hypothetical protein
LDGKQVDDASGDELVGCLLMDLRVANELTIHHLILRQLGVALHMLLETGFSQIFLLYMAFPLFLITLFLLFNGTKHFLLI